MSKAKSKSEPYKQPILPIVVLFLLLSTGLTLLFVLMSRTNPEPQQPTATITIVEPQQPTVTPATVASEPRLIHTINLLVPIRDLAFSRTNQLAVLAFNRIYLADLHEDDIVYRRELFTTQDIMLPMSSDTYTIRVAERIRHLAFDTNGLVLFAGAVTDLEDPIILRWDMTTGEELPPWRAEEVTRRMTGHGFAEDFAMGDSEVALLLTSGTSCSRLDFTLYQWDLETGESVALSLPPDVPHIIDNIEYSGDVFATQLSRFTGCPPQDSQIAIFRNGELSETVLSRFRYMTLSPDGQYLAGTAIVEPATLEFPYPKYGVFIWQNRELRTTPYETKLLQDLAFTSDNRYLFVVSLDSGIQMLMIDVALGERIHEFEMPVDHFWGWNEGEGTILEVSPDGRYLAVGIAGMLFVWSLE
jgi:WD40 repeat protein